MKFNEQYLLSNVFDQPVEQSMFIYFYLWLFEVTKRKYKMEVITVAL